MSIEEQLTTRLKEAMRAHRDEETSVLRMIKTLAQTMKTAPGFTGPTDDAFWIDVISRYVKQQQRALAEFEKAGAAASPPAALIRFEIEYLAPFLPRTLDDDEIRKLVREAIAEIGVSSPKMAGRVVGAVVKAHRDRVDPATVKRIAEEELGRGAG